RCSHISGACLASINASFGRSGWLDVDSNRSYCIYKTSRENSMPMHSTSKQLWRDVQVFDGLAQLDEAMNVLVENGRIAGLWSSRTFDETLAQGAVEAGRGGVMTPGLVDCHTHLVYAGDRAGEFEQRLEGVSYEEIARAGGGIISSVRATRTASEDDLIAASLPRLDALLADGVTTLEIKSGYGLTVADE